MAPTITTQPYASTTNESPPSLTLSQTRSRSVSFSPLSIASPITPSTPHDATTFPIRWSKELEQRLRHAQKSMEEHQKRWSEGQEEYWEEVEALQDLKRRFERFVRRRSKDHSREGKRFLRAASVGSSDVEMTPAPTPEIDHNSNNSNRSVTKKPTISLLRRFSAVVANSVHHEASLVGHRPRVHRPEASSTTPTPRNPDNVTSSRSPSMPVSPRSGSLVAADGDHHDEHARPGVSTTLPTGPAGRSSRASRRSLTA